MRGRTVLVTGSTGGIGKETARGLAARGARVLLVGRDPARARQAAEELGAGGGQVEAIAADVTRLEETARVAAWVASRCDRLDVLVNNVGASPPRRTLTADGVEVTFAAHVLAPFTLTRLLLPVLGGRVVNITGGIPGGPIEPDNLQAERRYLGWTFSQYNHTKTMLMAMSLRFAEQVAGGGVTVNVAYPGHGHTPMNQAMTMTGFPYAYRPLVPLLRVAAPRLFGDLTKPARSSVYLASSTEVDGVNGAYFSMKCRRTAWPAGALDPHGQDAVWALCERLSGAVV
ncbi:3-oxoacyl-ACP reductase [Sphaerisporangium krabiense]|uniref:NAD(P)-dependent dehydrogenase (Short-subunit alcohol dehydrogenase family) n=1 Tax=Sphaerisporangium krabiense TaxID=763782 RepID=A0A7W8Z539_9ACTN|nr:SDR family NAD(P)-dependent oxidoreductase [Sphaerisporangium krabiense]MBB5627616.1 NAD(P)-dependent dehydrogenase (short-subunit alcohol dehydrogenase family) [Sphaerisporangium krabiense]GII66630.1 3-oxoacyl-ACP reductase [Sphaerisporangium krabiense]